MSKLIAIIQNNLGLKSNLLWFFLLYKRDCDDFSVPYKVTDCEDSNETEHNSEIRAILNEARQKVSTLHSICIYTE